MDLKLNILHIIAALGTAGCVRMILPEARGRLLRPGRLFLSPSLALLTAAILLFLLPPDARQPRLWLLALAAGSAAGALRGYTMHLQVDREFSLLRLPNASDGLWSAAALVALAAIAVLIEIVLPVVGGAPLEVVVEMLAAAGAALCAGFLCLRAGVVYIRHLRAAHVQLLRL